MRCLFLAIALVGYLAADGRPSVAQISSATATNEKSESISSDRLSYELALTRKVLGDELFIGKDFQGASAEYKNAKEALTEISPNASDVEPNLRGLLSDEIEYRQLLLQNGLSFWGAAYARQPLNPPVMYNRFIETVDQFSAVAEELNVLLYAAAKGGSQIASTERNLIEDQKTADVAALVDQKAMVQRRFEGKQIKLLSDRKDDIQRRQIEIEQKARSLRSELEAANATTSALVARGLGQAIGVPDLRSVQAVAKGEPLDKSVLAVANTLLADGNSKLAISLKDYSNTSRKFVDFMRSAQQVTQDVETVKRASNVFRARSIDGIIDIGTSVYSHLDGERQAQIAGLVHDPSLASLINLAKKGRAIRQQVANYILKTQDVQALARPMIAKLIRTQFDDFQEYFSDVLAKSASNIKATEQARSLLDTLSQNWSEVLSHEVFSADMIMATAKASRIDCTEFSDCRARVAQQIRKVGLRGLPGLEFDQKHLELKDISTGAVIADVPLQDLVTRTVRRQMDSTAKEIAQRANQTVDQIASIDEQYTEKLLVLLPNNSFEQEVEPLLKAPDSSVGRLAVAATIVQQGDGELRTLSENERAAFVVGDALASQSIDRTLAPGQEPLKEGSTEKVNNSKSGVDRERAVAMQALAMAGPYGAVIASAVQIADSMARVSDLAGQINKLHDEDTQLTIQLIHLEDLLEEARLSDAFADLDDRIARRQQQAAISQRDVLQAAFLDAAEQQQNVLRRAKILMPRLWLLAELTRERFDALDRSLSTWVGNPAARESELEDIIRSDQTWARFGLDSEIGIYNWLDRGIEGERRDIDRLKEHWQQLKLLANSVCAKFKCDKTEAAVNQFNSTEEISLSELLSQSDRDRLFDWQAHPNGEPSIDLPFFLAPNMNGLPTHLEGVRFADVALSAAVGDERSPLSQAQLLHTGVGYVRIGDSYVRESFVPQLRSTIRYLKDPAKASELIDQLPRQWAVGGTSLGDVVGYPFYSMYILKIYRGENTSLERMRDIRVRFFYSYRSHSVSSSSDELAVLLSRDHYWVACDGSGAGDIVAPIESVAASLRRATTQVQGAILKGFKLPGAKNCRIQDREE
jgi:hypothetical protein